MTAAAAATAATATAAATAAAAAMEGEEKVVTHARKLQVTRSTSRT